jgi:PTH1 family peptidyl-tRNA hydrolase
VDVIVGLGNPGLRYRYHRHNIGYDVIDALADRHGMLLRGREFDSVCGAGRIGSRAVMLAKPQTFMNNSGEAVAPLVRRYLRGRALLVVVHDDIDLALGKLRLKEQGGDAGHRGIRSISQCLQSDQYLRLRLGVGRPPHKDDVVGYVLSPFSDEETDGRRAMIDEAVERLEDLLNRAEAPMGGNITTT